MQIEEAHRGGYGGHASFDREESHSGDKVVSQIDGDKIGMDILRVNQSE